MLVAVAAVFLMRVFDGFTKVTQFCALRSGAGLPDADCDMHELMALVRLAVGFLTTLVALTSSFVTMLLRDLLVGAGTQKLPTPNPNPVLVRRVAAAFVHEGAALRRARSRERAAKQLLPRRGSTCSLAAQRGSHRHVRRLTTEA